LEEASLSTDFQIPQGYQPVAAIGVDARATIALDFNGRNEL
jgi:hypothetical protein